VLVVLKLLKMAVSVRALLDTVVQALPEVGNLGLLFFLLFYIFAALGVELFGRVGEQSAVIVMSHIKNDYLHSLMFYFSSIYDLFSTSVEGVIMSARFDKNVLQHFSIRVTKITDCSQWLIQRSFPPGKCEVAID